MTTGQDSIYHVARIQDMTITRPHEVLALLDTAEQKSPNDTFRYQSPALPSLPQRAFQLQTRALRYALEAYKLPSAREDTEVLLSLVELIADEYYMEGDYANSVRYCGRRNQAGARDRQPVCRKRTFMSPSDRIYFKCAKRKRHSGISALPQT